jgi:hypothetical protein
MTFTEWWHDFAGDGMTNPNMFYDTAKAAWEASRKADSTPNTSLPPLVPDGPRRRMLIEIEVSANFEKRLDNQWEVEREINADRWLWHWKSDPSPDAVAEHIAAMVEGLSHSSIGREILRTADKGN